MATNNQKPDGELRGIFIPLSTQDLDVINLLCRLKGVQNHRELFLDLIKKELKRIREGDNLPVLLAETLKNQGAKWLKEKVGLKM